MEDKETDTRCLSSIGVETTRRKSGESRTVRPERPKCFNRLPDAASKNEIRLLLAYWIKWNSSVASTFPSELNARGLTTSLSCPFSGYRHTSFPVATSHTCK